MSNVLKPTGNQGDFVRQGQKMSGDVGFASVSRKWYDKTMSYEDATKQIYDEQSKRLDIMCKVSDFKVELRKSAIVLVNNGVAYTPTEHALRQFATRCGVPHTFVNWVGTNEDLNDIDKINIVNFLDGMRKHFNQENKYRWRTSGSTLRAVLTEDYAPIDNVWYINMLKEALPGGRVSHWRGDADDIYGNVLMPDSIIEGNDGEYGGMISVGNSEIGIRRFEQYPSVFRAICMNGCIWDQNKGEVVSKVHRGKIDLVDLRGRLFDNINKQIPLIPALVERFLDLRKLELPKSEKLTNVIATVGLDNSLTGNEIIKVAEQFAQYEKGDRNVFGIVNAITRAGQLYDNQTWVKYDRLAGQFMGMTPAKWESLRNRAKVITEKQLIKSGLVTAA